jgi:hypothetical protein
MASSAAVRFGTGRTLLSFNTVTRSPVSRSAVSLVSRGGSLDNAQREEFVSGGSSFPTSHVGISTLNFNKSKHFNYHDSTHVQFRQAVL